MEMDGERQILAHAEHACRRFEAVDAVDPSQPMLDVARESGVPNVRWICSTTEHAPLEDSYDLVTAGTSIHWMDPAVVFPRLRKLLDGRGFVAVLNGDPQTAYRSGTRPTCLSNGRTETAA